MGNVKVPEPYRVYTLRSEKVLIVYQVPERPADCIRVPLYTSRRLLDPIVLSSAVISSTVTEKLQTDPS
jgi:hypothetical protein